jgi:hypothetical protein
VEENPESASSLGHLNIKNILYVEENPGSAGSLGHLNRKNTCGRKSRKC